MDLHLQDKVALVTGGSRGLGRAICLGLAAEGARVAVNYHRGQAAAAEVVQAMRTLHSARGVSLQADVANSADVARMFEECEAALGPIDILVNNAGVWPTAFVREMDEKDWDLTFQVNVKAAFLTCREAVRRWLDAGRGGRIVNISTQAAFHGSTTGHSHYAASKAALVNFTVSLAREVARSGIFVNGVAPGMMRTDMAREALEENEDKYIQRTPLGRIAEPAEIADTVVFLASDRASYTTGATFDATGGMLMR
ncbi:MAG: SDR family NAD(P)-dependent oxidoreductase [Thermoguttaceae bacterium]